MSRELALSSGKLTEEAGVAPLSGPSKSPPPLGGLVAGGSGSPAQAQQAKEERMMRGRVEEAAEHLNFARCTEFREHEAAKISMTDVRTVKRDVELVRQRMRAHYFGLLDPHSTKMQVWDLLVILALGYTVCVTPYEISFLPNADWSPASDLAITALFSFDIVKEFFLPYRLSHKLGGRKITNHKMIAKRYLRTWAVVDIVGTVPVDLIFAMASTGSTAADVGASSSSTNSVLKATKMVRLARLLRLGRVLRASRVLSRLLERLESYVTVSFTQREVAFWTLAMLVAFHWLSCLWGLLANLRTSQRSPELEAARLLTWEVDAGLPCERGPGECLSACEISLLAALQRPAGSAAAAAAAAAGGGTGVTPSSADAPDAAVSIEYRELWLCRAITSRVLPREEEGEHFWYYLYVLSDMTLSFGIGVYPRHPIEHALAFLCMIVNMVMNTFFLGVIATAMSQSDPLTRDFKARMDRLNHYLRETDAPSEMKRRAREYLKYTRDLFARKSFDDVFANFSPRLRDDMHAHSSLRTLLSVPLFQSCEDGFLRSLAPKLTRHGYEAGESVVLSEASLCIVTRGTGVKGGKPITLLQFWGEDFVLSAPALRDVRPASALTYMEIVCLSRSALVESMAEFPDSAKRIRVAALHFAMLRAPMLIARCAARRRAPPHSARLAPPKPPDDPSRPNMMLPRR